MGGRKRDWEGPPFGKHEFQDQCDECLAECWPNLRKLEGMGEFREHMRANKFQFAVRSPKAPHWYTLRKTWRDSQEWRRRDSLSDPAEQELFIQCVQFIREHGQREVFWGAPYIKLLCDGFKYWSMGWPLDVTILINRAEHPSPVFDELGNRLKKPPKNEEEGGVLERKRDDERLRRNLEERKKLTYWKGAPYGRHEARGEWSLEAGNWDGYDECLAECWPNLRKLEGLDEFREHMRANKWQFGKTTPWAPHWYTLRKTWRGSQEWWRRGQRTDPAEQELFAQCIQFIREHGEMEWYGKEPFLKLICDGFKYWSNGWPLDVCVVINRAEYPSPAVDEGATG